MEVLCQIKQNIQGAELTLFNMAHVAIPTNAMFVGLRGNPSVHNVKKIFILVGVECPSRRFSSLGAFTGSRVGGGKS